MRRSVQTTSVPHPQTSPTAVPSRSARTGVVIGLSAVAGVVLAVLWSFELVDSIIGDQVADGLLGYDAKQSAIAGTAAALVFAFVSGLAGTFTACNIAMAASVGPMAQAGGVDASRRGSVRLLL